MHHNITNNENREIQESQHNTYQNSLLYKVLRHNAQLR